MSTSAIVDLVGVGLNATDTLIQLEKFPEPGSKIEYSDVRILPGGQAATTVIACAMWGMSARYVGKVGDDAAAALHKQAFAAAGVDARLIEVQNAASAQSLILVDAEGERTVLCRTDERLRLQAQELKQEWVTAARIFHTDGHDIEAATCAARWARGAGMATVADLDEIYEGVEELMANIDYLIVSRDFPTRYTGEASLENSLRTLHQKFGCRLAAATLGVGGVMALDENGLMRVPAYQVPARDTTGAGDVFHAGFIYGLWQKWPLRRTLEFASAAAALNCRAVGARGIAEVKEIETLMRSGRKYPFG